MSNQRTFLLATHNSGKARGLLEHLVDLDVEWRFPADCPDLSMEVEETGATLAENARLKAEAFARASGLPVLADDSGLEVDALGGAPGVLTARFGGHGLTRSERIALLLTLLDGLPPPSRTARFRCVLAIATPDGRPIRLAEGVCEGRIALAPAGEGGFGYDPIFFIPSLGRTMAQLTPEEKQWVSHRAQAARAARPLILDVLQPRNR